jgi:DNA-binding CsgD family transcriptional regulator
VAVLSTVLAAAAAQSVLTTPTEGLSSLAALLVATYSASAYPTWRWAFVGAVLLVLGVALIGQNSGDEAFLAVVLGGAWLTGFVVGQRSDEVARLTDSYRDLAERLETASALLSAAEQRAALGRAPVPDDLAVLTPRELEVVRAMATGRSNAEIADLLVISEWTVKTHVASILRKLVLRDRAQVVVAAYEAGLVSPGQASH